MMRERGMAESHSRPGHSKPGHSKYGAGQAIGPRTAPVAARAANGFAAVLALLLTSPGFAAEKRPAPPGKLTIVSAEILDSENGYPVPADSVFFPGETVHLRFRVDGYTRGEYDRVKLSYRLDSFGPAGNRFVMAESGKIDTELAPQDENWKPIIRHSPALPHHAGTGDYRVALHVVDELSQAKAEYELLIHVRGEDIEAASRLTIRNFSLAKVEGGAAVPDALFEPGKTIYGSFFITGYRTSRDNRFEIDAELRFVNEDGKVLFRFEPDGETGSPFYPRLWLPGSFKLELDKTLPPGNYALILRVNDKLGKANYQTRKSFQVR